MTWRKGLPWYPEESNLSRASRQSGNRRLRRWSRISGVDVIPGSVALRSGGTPRNRTSFSRASTGRLCRFSLSTALHLARVCEANSNGRALQVRVDLVRLELTPPTLQGWRSPVELQAHICVRQSLRSKLQRAPAEPAPKEGFEPSPISVTGSRSTVELPRKVGGITASTPGRTRTSVARGKSPALYLSELRGLGTAGGNRTPILWFEARDAVRCTTAA